MKAAVYKKFGPPEVLEIREVETPRPADNEVLIRIHAATVEKEDPGMRKSPGLNGILKPKRTILGMELSGEIEAVGREVTRFNPGDLVYGNAGMKLGTYAEYICIPEDGALALKPSNLSHREAAALTNGSLTALPFLRDQAELRAGQRILINGASGTVGSAAVQIAKYYGAQVTGVCRTANLEAVKALGADEVIDYTAEDFTRRGGRYDVIFDVAGKTSYARCKSLLNPDGVYLATVPTPSILFHMLRTRLFGSGRKVRFAATGLRSADKKAADLHFLKKIAEEGKLRPRIDRSFRLEEIAEAHRYLESGAKNGTVVIEIAAG